MLTETSTGSAMATSFLEGGVFLVNQKGNKRPSSIEFDVLDGSGKPLGKIVQKQSVGYKLLRLFIKKQTLPLTLHLCDTRGSKMISVVRGWTLSAVRISIKNAEGQEIGAIRPKLSRSVTQYKIFKEGSKIAEINSGGEEWNFTIIDKEHVIIGDINKNFPADVETPPGPSGLTFRVGIQPGYSDPENRILVAAAALTLDIVVKGTR